MAEFEFQWSTPVRRVGARLLSPIPLEIYLKIYSYSESDDLSTHESRLILSKLAKVCRFFFAHSMARIYRTLDLDGREVGTGHNSFCGLLLNGSRNAAKGAPLDKAMRMSLQIAPCVEECTFRGWLYGEGRMEAAEAFLERSARAVRLMTNVKTIRIVDTPLNKTLVRTIYELENSLKTLSIRGSPLQSGLSSTAKDALLKLNLSELEFFLPADSGREIPPSTLRLKDLKTFRTDSWPLTEYFLKRLHPHLTRLELHVMHDLEALFKFLAKCPTLTELAVINVRAPADRPTAVPPLEADTLPVLASLHIPPLLLSALMRRTVRTLNLLGTERTEMPGRHYYPHLAQLLPQKLVDVVKDLTELHVPEHVYFTVPLHKHIRRLQTLVLSYCHPNYPEILHPTSLFQQPTNQLKLAITTFCKKWPAASLPHLRELRLERAILLDTVNWDLPNERALIVDHLVLSFPALERFSRTPVLVWERSEEVGWTPFVPQGHREVVSRVLVEGTSYTDLHGVLGRLDAFRADAESGEDSETESEDD